MREVCSTLAEQSWQAAPFPWQEAHEVGKAVCHHAGDFISLALLRPQGAGGGPWPASKPWRTHLLLSLEGSRRPGLFPSSVSLLNLCKQIAEVSRNMQLLSSERDLKHLCPIPELSLYRYGLKNESAMLGGCTHMKCSALGRKQAMRCACTMLLLASPWW